MAEHRRWNGVVAALLLAVLMACSDSPSLPETDPPPASAETAVELEAITLSDTVGARIMQPIVGRVVGSGLPRAGVTVTIQVTARAATVALRATADGPRGGSGLTLTSDNQGRIEFFVDLNTASGIATLNLRPSGVPFSTNTQLDIEVLPGAATSVELGTVPELLRVGASVLLRGAVRDAHGNRTREPIDYSVIGPADVSDSRLSPSAWGNLRVIATYGALADSGDVVAVPEGRILISTGQMLALRLDASDVDQIPFSSAVGDVTSDPTGRGAAFGYRSMIYVSDFETSVQITGTTPYRAASLPRYAPDGSLIYFIAEFTDRGAEVWRISPDGGTVLERVTEVPVLGNADRHPAPSNGGDRLVFSRTTGGAITGPLTVRDLDTGIETPLGVDGQSSRWAPDDSWIAYLDPGAEIRRIRPDGSGDEPLLTGAQFFKNFAWSPDGRFFIAADTGTKRLHLLEIGTGQLVVLPFPHDVTGVDWYPDE